MNAATSRKFLLLPVLKKIPIFQGLDDENLCDIIQHITTQCFTKGSTVFNEGDEPDALYIIQSGIVEIYHPEKEGKQEQKLATLTTGHFFGEMALISGQKRGASVRITDDAIIFTLQKETFQKLLETNSHIANYVSTELMHRLEHNLRKE